MPKKRQKTETIIVYAFYFVQGQPRTKKRMEIALTPENFEGAKSQVPQKLAHVAHKIEGNLNRPGIGAQIRVEIDTIEVVRKARRYIAPKPDQLKLDI